MDYDIMGFMEGMIDMDIMILDSNGSYIYLRWLASEATFPIIALNVSTPLIFSLHPCPIAVEVSYTTAGSLLAVP